MSTTEVAEVVEETLDIVDPEWVCEFTRKEHLVQMVILGVVAGGLGGVFAYHVGKKQMKAKYEAVIDKEIAEAKAFYSALNKQGDFSTPEKAVEKLNPAKDVEEAATALLQYQGQIEEDEEVEPEAEEDDMPEEGVNVFIDSMIDDDFDINVELQNRSSDRPYVIHENEFAAAELDFTQTSITYYAGDGTLADERDVEIPFADPIVGEENLERFGHGSGDPRVVYIRNERLSTDFEVLKDDAKFAHKVLGFEHSGDDARTRQRKNKLHKFRGEDE